MATFDTLPESVIVAVCYFLDYPSIKNLSIVNKFFRKIYNNQSLWKGLLEQGIHFPPSPAFVKTVSLNVVPNAPEQPNYQNMYMHGVKHSKKKWKLNQVFGEDPTSVNLENVITSVEFDPLGEYLSIGYQCGQVVIFNNTTGTTFKFYSQFESHHPEFDFLTSVEIDEKIQKIRWLPHRFGNNARMLLTSNEKTIKLWRLKETKPKKLHSYFKDLSLSPSSSPKSEENYMTTKEVVQKRTYANAHAYNVNGLSLSADGQVFLSSDDLRINLWNLESNKEAFTMVDVKPTNMNDLNEVITSCEFHPTDSHMFAWGSSRGALNLVDMRCGSLLDRQAKVLKEKEDQKMKSFFSEVTNSISDVKFTKDGRWLVSRDYLTLKIWDLAMDSRPLSVIPVQEMIRPRLYELYEQDHIFDKFDCRTSPNGWNILTGSYSNYFMMYSMFNSKLEYIQAVNPRDKKKKKGTTPAPAVPNLMDIDFSEKIMKVDWHPTKDLCAVAAGNYIFLYHLSNNT